MKKVIFSGNERTDEDTEQNSIQTRESGRKLNTNLLRPIARKFEKGGSQGNYRIAHGEIGKFT